MTGRSWTAFFGLLHCRFKLLLSDPWYFLTMCLLPLIVMIFLRPSAVALTGSATQGAAQVVAGMSVMFAITMSNLLGHGIFMENSWSTWLRLRVSAPGMGVVLAAHAIAVFVLILVQQAALVTFGALLFGAKPAAQLLLLLCTAMSLAALVVSIALLITSFVRSMGELGAATQVASLALAGVGGAFAPREQLPASVVQVARYVPSYWMVQDLRAVLSGTASSAHVLRDCGVTMLVVIIVAGIALRAFDVARPSKYA